MPTCQMPVMVTYMRSCSFTLLTMSPQAGLLGHCACKIGLSSRPSCRQLSGSMQPWVRAGHKKPQGCVHERHALLCVLFREELLVDGTAMDKRRCDIAAYSLG